MKILLFSIGILLCSLAAVNSKKMVFCYYGSWAIYRQGDAKFSSSEIDPTLCTHVGYTFFGVTNDGTVRTLDDWCDNGLQNIAKLEALKKINPELKTILVVGGWNEGTTNYKAIAKDPKKIQTFIDTSLKLIKQYNFNGLDLDWEYPAFPDRGGDPVDKENFITWIDTMKKQYQPLGLTVSAAVYSVGPKASTAYDIAKMGKILDYINVMAYDLYGEWDKKTGCHTALEGTDIATLNVRASIDYWLANGCPPEKLVLGLGTYGRSFTLANAANNGLNAAITGPGQAGPHTRAPGFLGYNEICLSLCDGKMKENFNDKLKVPIGIQDRLWVSYDNPKSIKIKIDEIVVKKKLLGAMIWSIETDDFRGKCGTKYPLLKAINNALDGKSNSANDAETCTPTVIPDNPVTPPPVTPPPDNPNTGGNTTITGKCPSTVLLPYPNDCSKYIQCDGATAYERDCPPPLLFNAKTQICDWAVNAQCAI